MLAIRIITTNLVPDARRCRSASSSRRRRATPEPKIALAAIELLIAVWSDSRRSVARRDDRCQKVDVPPSDAIDSELSPLPKAPESMRRTVESAAVGLASFRDVPNVPAASRLKLNCEGLRCGPMAPAACSRLKKRRLAKWLCARLAASVSASRCSSAASRADSRCAAVVVTGGGAGKLVPPEAELTSMVLARARLDLGWLTRALTS